jgi:GDPmannose 4,6-dehydratase
MKRKAFITGIGGQDGSYLAELLLEKGYEVHGIIRRNSTPESQQTRLDHLQGDIHVEYGDLLDVSSLEKNISVIQPDEIYNLGAQSHVRISFDLPQFTFQTNALGTLNLLEAFKKNAPHARYYQASSSEMFGNSIDVDGFQRETTPMHPVSPYGCAKLAAYALVRNYRHSYKLFASNGILFNHESPRRGSNFVTSKVVKAAVRIKFGLQNKLEIGNNQSYRDWGHSKDYVKAMWSILQQENPVDLVISTMQTHSVKELCDHVFKRLELDPDQYIFQNPKFLRPEELKYLKGDSTKAREQLNWKPEYNFETLLDEMIEFWVTHYNNGGH